MKRRRRRNYCRDITIATSLLLTLSSLYQPTHALVVGKLSSKRAAITKSNRNLMASTATVLSPSTTAVPFPGFAPGIKSDRFKNKDILGNFINNLLDKQRKVVSNIAMVLTGLLVATNLEIESNNNHEKQINLSNEELAKIIIQDNREKQFLFTADMTKSIYDDNARFKDGSNLDGSYPMNAWIRGCKLLFDATKSQSTILEHTLQVTKKLVQFRFAETLTFRTFFRPKVFLTGSVIMKRDEKTGLIISYEEKWDQDIKEIFRRTKLAL